LRISDCGFRISGSPNIQDFQSTHLQPTIEIKDGVLQFGSRPIRNPQSAIRIQKWF